MLRPAHRTRFFKATTAYLAIIATLVTGSPLQAAVWVWNGNSGNLADTTQWSIQTQAGGTFYGAPSGGDATDQLIFNGVSAFTVQNNWLSASPDFSMPLVGGITPFVVNQLQFNNTASGSIIAGSGAIRLAGTTPTIFQNNVGSFTVQPNLDLTGSLTLGGALLPYSTAASGPYGSALGSVNLAGNITESTTGSTISKTSLGNVTLSGADSFTGATTVTGGTLTLDYTTNNGSKLSSAAALTLDGAGLIALGNATSNSSETVKGLVLGSGASSVSLTAGGTQTATLDFSSGGLTRTAAGSTIDFTLGGTPTNDTIKLSAATSAFVGGFATVNGTDWATLVSGVVAPMAAASYTVQNSAASWLAAQNITNSAAYSGAAPTVAINSLRFNAPATSALSVASSATLTITGGGILETAAVGAFNSTITAGTTSTIHTGLASTSGGDLSIIQNNPLGSLTINPIISNNGSTVAALTKSGPGALVLGGANTYTGGT
ncbi:MAG TPA: autotransporter-associated beta strand repeat-containing protein, partial [Pirellulales bacterium]